MLCILPDSCVAFICVTFYPNNLMISCSVQYLFYHSSWTIHNSLLRCPLKLIRSSIFPVCLSTAYHFSTGKYICIDIFYFGATIINMFHHRLFQYDTLHTIHTSHSLTCHHIQCIPRNYHFPTIYILMMTPRRRNILRIFQLWHLNISQRSPDTRL